MYGEVVINGLAVGKLVYPTLLVFVSATSSKKKVTKDYSLFSYMFKILHIVYSNLQKRVIENNENVIKVDVKHINVTTFNITYDEKMMLVCKGQEAVRNRINDIKSSISH